jgi:probable F420-dependent oxidoreductase
MVNDGITFGAAALPEPEREWIAEAEELPIDSIWQGGHVLPPAQTGEAITRLALMTAWTERVQVGTSVLLLPLYNPVLVAKQLADLDSRSGGRIAVGVGVGGEFPSEFEALGIPLKERGARTDEAMQVLRTLWSGETVSHHGRFFNFDDVKLRPVAADRSAVHAMQSGGPPLSVSGRKDVAMRRAARHGDGWMPYLVSPSAYARSVTTIREAAGEIDRDMHRFEWMIYLYTSIRQKGDDARDDVVAFLGDAYGTDAGPKLERIAPAGTPAEVAVRFQEYVDAGVRRFIISPAAHENTLEIIKLATEEVLPRLALPPQAS